MNSPTLSSNSHYGQLLNPKISMRLRAFRSMSERYVLRERPSVVPEFTLFALIVLLATWPMVTLVHVMSLIHR